MAACWSESFGCGQPLREYRGPGQCVAPQSVLSQGLTEAGVTGAVHLRGPAPRAASSTQPVKRCGWCLLCPKPKVCPHSGAQQRLPFFRGSGRAGPSVFWEKPPDDTCQENSRREEPSIEKLTPTYSHGTS